MRFHFDRAGSFGLSFVVLLVALVGCDGGGANGEQDGGRLDGGRPDAATLDGGSDPTDGGDDEDGGHADDGGPADDGGTELDGAIAPDGGSSDGGSFMLPDACVPPPCAAPPEGCMYVGSDPCSCGTLVCPSDCNGVTCGPGEYCDFEAPFTCGGNGTCLPRPDFCLAVFMPVCGCDGVTHSNECEANGAGTDVAADGECGAAPADCRTTGCRGRETCQECRGADGPVYVCLPRGAVC